VQTPRSSPGVSEFMSGLPLSSPLQPSNGFSPVCPRGCPKDVCPVMSPYAGHSHLSEVHFRAPPRVARRCVDPGHGSSRVVPLRAQRLTRSRSPGHGPFSRHQGHHRIFDKVRRRVQNETLGHRGRSRDPLYRSHKLMPTGGERLDHTAPNGGCLAAARRPHNDVLGAWLAD